MPRPLLIALIAFVASATGSAQDVDPRKLPAVKRVLDDAAKGVKANRNACDKANEAQLAKARDELKEIAKKLLDDGKTEAAAAILNQVKTLDREVLGAANTPATVPGSQKPLLEKMSGRWTHPNADLILEIDSSGTYREVRKSDRSISTTGRLVLKTKGVASSRLANGFMVELRVVGEDDAIGLFLWDPTGSPAGDGSLWLKMP
jgi:hypothetical protein